jgi:hypothetical protein
MTEQGSGGYSVMAFAHKVGYDRGRADIRDEGRNTG